MFLISPSAHIWKSMAISVPLKPPLQPRALVTAVVLVVYAEAPGATFKLISSFGQHVKVVFGGVIDQVGY